MRTCLAAIAVPLLALSSVSAASDESAAAVLPSVAAPDTATEAEDTGALPSTAAFKENAQPTAAERVRLIRDTAINAMRVGKSVGNLRSSLQALFPSWEWAVAADPAESSGASTLRDCMQEPQNCIFQGALTGTVQTANKPGSLRWAVFWTPASIPLIRDMRRAQDETWQKAATCFDATTGQGLENYADCIVRNQGDMGIYIAEQVFVTGSFDKYCFISVFSKDGKQIIGVLPLGWYTGEH